MAITKQDGDSSSITKAETGWVWQKDDEYTEASPLSIDDSRVQITVDGLNAFSEEGYKPEGHDLWQGSSIKMPSLGSTFIMRLDWKAKAATTGAYFDFQVDMGDGSPIIITQKTLSIVKGINAEQRFSETVAGFCLATFLANGAKVYFDTTDDSSNLSVYDVTVLVMQIRKP